MQTKSDTTPHHLSSMRLILYGAFFLVIAILLYVSALQNRSSTRFFTQALSSADVRESVQWRGASYRVEGGVIHGAGGHVRTLPILALTYKKALAERAPLLALPGEDIGKLREGVRELAEARDILAASVDTPRESRAVRALYPIDFLTSLVDAEEARRAFVRSGSDTDGALYDAALETALSAHRRDLFRFRAAFSRAVQSDDISYAVADALVSKAAIESALEQLTEAGRATRALTRARTACVRGDTGACEPGDIHFPRITISEPVPIDDAGLRTAREIRQLLSGAFDIPEIESSPMVALSQSSCAHGFPGAPIFTMSTSRIAGTEVPAPYMLGDARFLRTDAAHSPFLQYVASEGVTYLWYPSLTHYKCLRLQSDTSAIIATLAVRTLALRSPLSAYAQDAALASRLRALEESLTEGAVAQESDAARYLSLAPLLYDDLPDALSGYVLTLTLQFKYGTGGLADTVKKIALIEKANLELSRRGIPTDLSVPRLFFSESGFVPLFLGDNGSLIEAKRPLLPLNTLKPSEEPYVFYSTMDRMEARSQLLSHDVTFFSELYRRARR